MQCVNLVFENMIDLSKFNKFGCLVGKSSYSCYRRIHADVIVYIFAHLHTALCTEGNMLDMN